MNFLLWIIMLVLGFFGISALKQRPPEPVTVQVPGSVSIKANFDSALIIQINEHNFQLSYIKDTVITKSKADIISFIRKYKFVDSEKILVRNKSTNNFEGFRNVKEAFKANGIYKFRIITDGEPMP